MSISAAVGGTMAAPSPSPQRRGSNPAHRQMSLGEVVSVRNRRSAYCYTIVGEREVGEREVGEREVGEG